jgi:hypothetical protein
MDMHICVHEPPIFWCPKNKYYILFWRSHLVTQAYYLVPLLFLASNSNLILTPNLLCETSQNALVANSKITVLIQSLSLQNNYLNKTKENKKVPISLLHTHGPQSHIHSLVSPTKRQKTMK